jgi:hypothetical protein
MNLNAAHLHLLANHFPIIGSILAVAILVLALARRGERGIVLASVLVLLISTAGGIVALRTGDGAKEIVEHLPGVTRGLIHQHEERADLSFWFLAVAAAASVGVLVASRRRERVPAAWTRLLLVVVAVAAFMMIRTGEAGGLIRHSEIRPGASSAGGETTGIEGVQGGEAGSHERGEEGDDD